MKKIAYDSMKLDGLKVVEDSKCCLKVNAVITKEGVYPYPDGRAFKSRMELLKATRTAKNAKITILDHPDSMVIMSQSQIYGTVEKPFFERDKIRAVLNFDKYVCPPKFLYDVRNGQLKDVSIGFYYAPDFKPGKWNGQPYDYVMRDIVIDHVAAGVLKGRCTYPSCGIGVDSVLRRIALDPFGEYKDFADCVAKNKDKTNPKAYCAWLHKQITGRYPGEDGFRFKFYGDVMKMDNQTYKLIFGDQDERPPKAWWDNCVSKARSFADDPARFCGWLWHHGDEPMKSSFGRSSVSIKGGKKTMSLEELFYPERSKEFNECVAKRLAEGADATPPITREQAEALCAAATKPEDEPTPFEKLDQDELSPWQQCIKEQMAEDKTMEEAIEACKAKGITKGDQDAAFENCVERKMEEDMSREEAEKACRAEHPVAEGDEEPEKTPMERCIASRMEATEDTEEEARTWCEAELAGEHESADALISRSKKLINLRQQSNIEKRRAARRHPL